MARPKSKSFNLPTQDAYPKKIVFGTETYRILFRKRVKLNGETCYAVTDPVNKTIVIQDGLSPRALFSTMIHELFHVIEFDAPVHLKHKTIYKLEKAVTELILDNFL